MYSKLKLGMFSTISVLTRKNVSPADMCHLLLFLFDKQSLLATEEKKHQTVFFEVIFLV